MTSPLNHVGLVAIGRNEGKRLHQCLLSALGKVEQLVYVDSGSTDGSLELARSLGVQVVELDLSIPFTAARARNAGLARLLEIDPTLEWVQFVDGDCELVAGWLEVAYQVLTSNSNFAVVCGRRRERFPDHSIYNRLCDLEWDTPVGEAKACGGDAMMRIVALQQVNGYNATLIAGEEPELCVRLRQQGWKIMRLDQEMTLHDAQMLKLSQWWKRTVRSGHAYAEGAWLHGKPPECHWVRETRSICLWGMGWPLLLLALAWPTNGISLVGLSIYPVLGWRIFLGMRRRALGVKDAFLYAYFCVLGKFPQAVGVLNFWWNKQLGTQRSLIEYKT